MLRMPEARSRKRSQSDSSEENRNRTTAKEVSGEKAEMKQHGNEDHKENIDDLEHLVKKNGKSNANCRPSHQQA